jgi:hypothetical protein
MIQRCFGSAFGGHPSFLVLCVVIDDANLVQILAKDQMFDLSFRTSGQLVGVGRAGMCGLMLWIKRVYESVHHYPVHKKPLSIRCHVRVS